MQEVRGNGARLECIFWVGGGREIGENTGLGIQVDLLRVFRVLNLRSVFDYKLQFHNSSLISDKSKTSTPQEINPENVTQKSET
jgi:hypothetical protein